MVMPAKSGAEGAMRALASAFAVLTWVGPAFAQSRDVSGQLGFLGEWEIIATVTEKVHNGVKQLMGPMSLKHVGVCSADGPEEKSGELRLRLSSAGIEATLLIEGSECTFRGRLKEAYDGVMNCPDRRAVPLSLLIK
jgi:hypothetical protein